MSDSAKRRARDRISRLTRQGLDLVTFWEAASAALAPAVPHYLSPCWYTLDPASLLVTAHHQRGLLEIPSDWFVHEYYEDDVHKLAEVARSDRGLSTVHDATGGEPSRSPAWNRFVRPLGGDQELLVALRARGGAVWGVLALYREPGTPLFDDAELGFLQDVAPFLADGARRCLLLGEAIDPEGPEAPGLVVLREDWTVDSLSPGVTRWLAELPDGDRERRGRLPGAVLAVAARALALAETAGVPGEVAFARVLTRDGRWLVLHGAELVANGSRRVSVIIQLAHPARIAPLLMDAYGLTEREQDVTCLVLQGNSTAEIATRLVVSALTVQQHLKSVFDKTGVRSRRELVGKVFFSHYEPRVRDNEHRAIDGRPLRGGPAAHPATM